MIEKFNTAAEYRELVLWLDSVRQRSRDDWADVMREYAMQDLYFLHRYILDIGKAIHNPLGVPLYEHDRYVEACRTYEKHIELGRSLDTSSRRTGKSEMRSCTIPIHLILNYPDISIFIFSIQKARAEDHFKRIMNELDKNKMLLYLFDDIFHRDPRATSASYGMPWSVTDGLCVKGRKINRSIQTVEAHALFGGGPTGTGPDVIILDDVENSSMVGSPEAIEKLDHAVSEAVSLVTPAVIPNPIIVFSNTRFAEAGLIQRTYDRYKSINEDMVRQIPSEDVEGMLDDKPAHWFTGFGPMGGRAVYPAMPEFLRMKWEESPIKSEYGLQYALSYKALSDRALKKDLIHFYDQNPKDLAKDCVGYIGVDASRGVVDPSCFWVWGVTHDKRKIWLDGVVRKLDPAQPAFHDILAKLATEWNNNCRYLAEIRVEDTVNSTWTELIERELRARGCYLPVRKCKTYHRSSAPKFKNGKMDRIYDRWAPMLNRGEVWMPLPISKGGSGIVRDIDGKGNFKDIVDYFFHTEFDSFPGSVHDDMLDAGALLMDEKVNADYPIQFPSEPTQRRENLRGQYNYGGETSWMSA